MSNKLQNIKTKTGTTKVPIVLENTVSYIEVELEKELDCGTHTIFVGNIVDCDVVSDAEPLTYAYYQQVKGGKSPKTAPTYVKDELRRRLPMPPPVTFAVFAAIFMTRLKAILIMALLPEQNLKICRKHGHVLSAARINQSLKKINSD